MAGTDQTQGAGQGARAKAHGAVPPLRIALAQLAGQGDLESNLARARRWKHPPALMVFPECFLTGYRVPDPTGSAITARQAQEAIGPVASEAGLAVVAGFIERKGRTLRNSAVAVGADGRPLAICRKRCLFGQWEQKTFAAGKDPCLFDLGGWRIGLCICYDIEFPEIGRELAKAGAALIVTPTALMRPHGKEIFTLVHARAIENEIHVAYANRVGREGDTVFVGGSRVVAPDGKAIAQAPGGAEQVVQADLKRAAPGAGQLRDLGRFLGRP